MTKPCGVCIRACPRGASFCGRRDAAGQAVAPHTYQALQADSLFDKPILHFGENIKTLSIGSWGCNLRCLGCQNARLSWTVNGEGLAGRELRPPDLVRLAVELNCRGLCFTFNEPAIILDSAVEAAKEARRAGLKTVFVTNSTLTPETAARVGPFFDAVAADIKSRDDAFYEAFCGTQGIAHVADKILDCILAFHLAGCHVEVRTNVIPGANDQDENLAAIADWIRNRLGAVTPWHITRFFPAYKLSHFEQTPPATIRRAERIGRLAGLRNVHSFYDRGCDCARETSLVAWSGRLGEPSPHDGCCKTPKGIA